MLKATAGVATHARPLCGVLSDIFGARRLMVRNMMNGNLFGRCTAAFWRALVAVLVIAAVQGRAPAALEVKNDFNLEGSDDECGK